MNNTLTLIPLPNTKQEIEVTAPKRKRSRGNRYVCAGKYCKRVIYGKKLCSRCRHRKLKMENPMEYAYRMQKSNAKKRKPKHFPNGIPFTLTREEFKSLWEQHPDKWEEKVKSLQNGNSRKRTCRWEIDRIDPYKGYEKGNVRLVSKIMNILYWYNNRAGQMEFDFTCQVEPVEGIDNWKDEVPF